MAAGRRRPMGWVDPLICFLLAILGMVPLVLWGLQSVPPSSPTSGALSPEDWKELHWRPPDYHSLHAGEESSRFVVDSNRNPSASVPPASPFPEPHEEEAKETKELPYLIIHMGPDKTGTTAIQSFLRDHREVLEQDGYDPTFSKGTNVQAHRRILAGLLQCFTKKATRPCHRSDPEGWNQRLAALYQPRSLGNQEASETHPTNTTTTSLSVPHVVWSTEGFRWTNFPKSPDWQSFLKKMRQHFRIQVVLVYRRYFDWMISRYHEDHRSSEYSGKALLLWPNDPTNIGITTNNTNHTNPPKGGTWIPTFEEYLRNEQDGICPPATRATRNCQNYFSHRLLRHPNHQGVEVLHPLLTMAEELAGQNVSVQVLNFHEATQDLRETFLCHVLPGATQTCSLAQRLVVAEEEPQVVLSRRAQTQQRLSTTRQSNLEAIQYDRLALEAYARGWIPVGMDRNTAKQTIYSYHQTYNNWTDLLQPEVLPYWTCPDQSLLDTMEATSEGFEDAILAWEKETPATAGVDAQHRMGPWELAETHAEAFHQALQDRKFCHLNVSRVLLEDEGLQAFLANTTTMTSGHRRRRKPKKNT